MSSGLAQTDVKFENWEAREKLRKHRVSFYRIHDLRTNELRVWYGHMHAFLGDVTEAAVLLPEIESFRQREDQEQAQGLMMYLSGLVGAHDHPYWLVQFHNCSGWMRSRMFWTTPTNRLHLCLRYRVWQQDYQGWPVEQLIQLERHLQQFQPTSRIQDCPDPVGCDE